MDFFTYKNGQLHCEDVPAERIAAEVGTPCYVYSKATLLHHYRQLASAFVNRRSKGSVQMPRPLYKFIGHVD